MIACYIRWLFVIKEQITITVHKSTNKLKIVCRYYKVQETCVKDLLIPTKAD